MTTRTTVSLDQNLFMKLKEVTKNEKLRSLSQALQNAASLYVHAYEKRKTLSQMEKNYKAYSRKHQKNEFADIEESALSDYFDRQKQ